jgi:signal transduction histidine kinase
MPMKAGFASTPRRPHFHGLNLLPEIFATRVRGTPAPPLRWRRHLYLAAILVPPLILTVAVGYGGEYRPRVNEAAHGLVEGFCALMSLVVFYVLHQEFINTGASRLRLMAFAFLVLGLLDGCHALCPPHSEIFVWLRSAAALASSAMLTLALGIDSRSRTVGAGGTAKADAHAAMVGASALIFVVISYALRDHLPAMLAGERFSGLALLEKGLAGLFYSMAGIAFLRYFRHSGENILFVLAAATFLLAESQWLAFFSDPWDVIWWTWHWIRTAVFVGILFGIAHEFVQSAKDLQMSHLSLVESEKLASLGEMAASVAHEIRNPLGTLTGSVGLLKDGRLKDAERSELIDIVEKEINRLNHIVSDTLDFAHARIDRLHVVNLETIVRDAVKLQAPRYPGVAAEVMFDVELPLMRGDESQLQRIVWNLFDNAAAAMAGQGRFSVSARREGENLELAFRDTGPGMAPETLNQVLKPFFTTKEGGVGLGLPIVQRMVLEHGGSMDINSNPGAGACVRIIFPSITVTSQ